MTETRIRRRRLVLSCFECKRRKLKCGREYPICSRCISGGSPELCKYDPQFAMGTDADVACPNQSHTWSPDISVTQFVTPTLDTFDPSLVNNDLQTSPWLQFQLGLDHENSHPEVLDGEGFINSSGRRKQQQPVSDRKRSFNAQFLGPSHPRSILASFRDLCDFIKETVEGHHILGASQWDSYAPSAEQPLRSYSKDEIEQVIKSALPTEERCRCLLRSFFHHLAGIYAPFHGPTFWREYQSYWDGTHNDSAQFNANLLAIISCSRSLFADDPLSFNGDSSTARRETAEWLHAAEVWQGYHETKSKTIEDFRLRSLILLSKKINDIDLEDHYSSAQTLLADAISNGLHRDWRGLGIDESIYDREIRSKVWSAISELDIAACIERGVTSMQSHISANIGRPKGYDHDDYSSSTETEPADRPVDHLTDSSFGIIAHQIRPLRHNVNNFVNDPQNLISVDKRHLKELRTQVFEALGDIPNWSEGTQDEAKRKQGLIYRAVLDLYLHELLILLHLPFALPTDKDASSSGDKEFQRFVCMRSASTTIKIHELLAHEGFSPITFGKSRLSRAGLCLCLLDEGTEMSPINYGITSLPISPDARTRLIGSALSMIEQHVLSLGTDLQSLWLFYAASCYIELRKDSTTSSVLKKRITDNIMALISRMCLAQEQKDIGFTFSDTHFRHYIMQIHQACDAVQLMVGII
ncbi:hypothetical protein BDV35DRAFT_260068 [Aspergillus flavus]|uniref:Zn(2)-C6 fungal-type domain-containing protein n=1 Tax=Aspergillus flavus TaxID=5059 RepID=A0A5N6GTU4_ASPFL|nr:hypothetical protein BDV35DRAFT_260068 [Aspergillus flavus]